MTKHTIKLDEVRELRFSMPAIVELDEACKINLMSSSSYDDFPPSKLVAIIWAGQLWTKKPLRRNQIAQYLPTGSEAYYAVCVMVAAAIHEAITDKTTPAK